MLHRDHVVAVLMSDLLVRDGAVMNRDGWDHVWGWRVTSCGESHALSAVVEEKRRYCWEDNMGQSGERVFSPQLLNLPLQFHPTILKPSPNLQQKEQECA